jgi:Zn-dependent protease with chaperone function
MTIAVFLPLLASGLFGLVAPGLARRLPPAIATWLLSVGGLCAGAGFAASLFLLSLTLVGQLPILAARGHWSDAVLHRTDPIWPPLAAAALLALAVLTIRFAVTGYQRLAALLSAHRLAAALSPASNELVVLDDAEHQAYAVPGSPGRIVVSRGLLQALTAPQRRGVLAHERAHLRQHHHLHHTAAQLAAAANPLSFGLPRAVALATERWADESASRACTRADVARALVTAATRASTGHAPTSGRRPSTAVLAVAETEVAARVQALARPARPLEIHRLALLLALLTVIALSTLHAAADVDRVFDLAQAAYHLGRN